MSLQTASPQHADLPRRARSEVSLAGYVSASDYPADALAQGIEGTVEFRLVVDPEGRVANCKIERSSGTASLDAQTCAVMTARARFQPARNRSGQPVIDTIRSRIAWRIGSDLPEGISSYSAYRAAIIFSVSTDGDLRCAVELNGVRQPTPDTCPYADAMRPMIPRLSTTRRMIVVETFTPEGGIISAPAIPYGQLLAESEADVTIAANGEISSCRSVNRTVHINGAPPPPDLCAYTPGPRYLPGAPNRRARVRSEVFLGIGTEF